MRDASAAPDSVFGSRAGSHASTQYCAPLTTLRGIAALAVVVYHYYQTLLPALGSAPVVARGYLWVDLFFVLSGYVLASVYGATWSTSALSKRAGPRAHTIWPFLQRRLARIYPLHAAIVLAWGAVHWLPWSRHLLRQHEDWGQWWRTLLLVHGWGYDRFPVWNVPSWSISVEWALYLLFPLLMFGLARVRSGALLMVAMAASVAAVAAFEKVNGTLNVVRLGLWRGGAEFPLGMVLCEVQRRGLAHSWLVSLGSSAGVLVTFATTLAVLQFASRDWVSIPCFCLLILACAHARGPARAILSAASVHWLGEVSYSIYLLHEPLLRATLALERRGVVPVHGQTLMGLLVTCLLVLSSLSYLLVEKPARSWLAPRKGLVRRR